MNTSESSFLMLARKPDLDQDTAFAICKMIDSVGWKLVEDWNWDWLKKKRKDYRSLIDPSLMEDAWSLLVEKDWFSLQDGGISTIAPLESMTNLRSLVLQNNLIKDLRPVSSMTELRYFNCHGNRVSDLAPIEVLKSLEELSIGHNPVASLRVLEELPHLRDFSISADQVVRLIECERLLHVQRLEIGGDDVVANFAQFPEMPSLKVLSAWNVRDLAGIDRFGSLETLSLPGGRFSSLDSLESLKALTHLMASTTRALSLEPLRGLFALRRLSITCPKVRGLASLRRLPVLHEVVMGTENSFDAGELEALRKELTPWDAEFQTDERAEEPSLHLEVVDQKTFDYYDVKQAFGVRAGEFNEGMLDSERRWLLSQISEALSVKFEKEKDFYLPINSGFRRSERLVLYSVTAYESFREVATVVQRILCKTRNDWIVYCQSLLDEGLEDEEVPEGMEGFIVWIYPNKIVATGENAETVRKLIEWRQ